MEELQQIEPNESLEMELTAKGLAKWTIKLRGKEIDTQTIERLSVLHNQMLIKFPQNVMTTS
jgi:hypothetical protein